MPQVLGVKLRRNGPLTYCDPGEERFALGEEVVIETVRGTEICEVVMPPSEVAERLLPADLRHVLRRATADDLAHREALQARAPELLEKARERAQARGLDIKLFSATQNLDESRILFEYVTEGKAAVADLAKELAELFQSRVDLRQVYARDEAKQQDGYGPCGRRLCCSSWLKEFQPVSIKHAKEQGLPLNPSKLNGMCGKLKCCLVYENDQYAEAKAQLPKPGEEVTLEQGPARVREINVPRELVMLTLVETGAVLAVPAAELRREPAPASGAEPADSASRRKRKRR